MNNKSFLEKLAFFDSHRFREDLKYNVDKSNMYGSTYGAGVTVVILLDSEQRARELYNDHIKNNRKLNLISPWRILTSPKSSEVYTEIMLGDHPVSSREAIVNAALRRIDRELEKLSITLGKVIPPRSNNEDYPDESESEPLG